MTNDSEAFSGFYDDLFTEFLLTTEPSFQFSNETKVTLFIWDKNTRYKTSAEESTRYASLKRCIRNASHKQGLIPVETKNRS